MTLSQGMDGSPPDTPKRPQDNAFRGQAYNPCNGGHHRGCYNTRPISRAVLDEALAPALRCGILHLQPCSETVCDKLRAFYRLNVVRAYKECTTDICFSAQDVEGIGRVIGSRLGRSWEACTKGSPRLGSHIRLGAHILQASQFPTKQQG
jgi:hypothetical protein